MLSFNMPALLIKISICPNTSMVFWKAPEIEMIKYLLSNYFGLLAFSCSIALSCLCLKNFAFKGGLSSLLKLFLIPANSLVFKSEE